MMNTPRLRASFTTSFMRGAISATRLVAPLHQCWFHMSQMTIEVFFGSHSTVFSVTCHWPLPFEVSARARVGRVNQSAPAKEPQEKRWRSSQHGSESRRLPFIARSGVNGFMLTFAAD